jgi:hypothetical protein
MTLVADRLFINWVNVNGAKFVVTTVRWAEAHKYTIYFRWECKPEPLASITQINKGDLAKIAGINDTVFDWAVPQPWADKHPDFYQFVWSYAHERIFGEPLNIYEAARSKTDEVAKQFIADPGWRGQCVY